MSRTSIKEWFMLATLTANLAVGALTFVSVASVEAPATAVQAKEVGKGGPLPPLGPTSTPTPMPTPIAGMAVYTPTPTPVPTATPTATPIASVAPEDLPVPVNVVVCAGSGDSVYGGTAISVGSGTATCDGEGSAAGLDPELQGPGAAIALLRSRLEQERAHCTNDNGAFPISTECAARVDAVYDAYIQALEKTGR